MNLFRYLDFNKKKFSKFKINVNFGFTLSEVLITLVIIGVVAAITVPNLVHSYHKKIVATRLKHTYSVVSQMLKLAEAKYGMLESWGLEDEYGGWDSDGATTYKYNNYNIFINTYMLPFLNGAEYSGGFSGVKAHGYEKNVLYPNGSVFMNVKSGYRFITLGNGVTLSPGIYSYGFSSGGSVKYYTYTIIFSVDIDGPQKGPNVVGKDIFFIEQLFENGRPVGMYGETSVSWDNTNKRTKFGNSVNRSDALKYCKQGNANSKYCGLLIKLDGWEIKKDYPW